MNNVRKFVVYFCIALIFAISLYRFMRMNVGVAEYVAGCVAYPFITVHYYCAYPFQQAGRWFVTKRALEARLKDLEISHQMLQESYIAAQAKVSFMEATQELQDFARRYDVKSKKLCRILMRELSSSKQSIIVDAGSRDGISEDMIAVYKNCLIGKVTRVYPFYASITLITDPSCLVAASCAGTEAQGVFEGTSTGGIMKFVSHLEKVVDGDIVVSSGKGLRFPQGFGLGKIAEATITGLEYTILLEPLVDIQHIDYCYIIY